MVRRRVCRASRHGPHASIGGARERVCHAVSAFDAGGLLSGYVRRVSSRGYVSINRGGAPDLMGGVANAGHESDLGVSSRPSPSTGPLLPEPVAAAVVDIGGCA